MSLSNDFGNPAFSEAKLLRQSGSGQMTVSGTIMKICFFVMLLLFSGGITMKMALDRMEHVDFSKIQTITETDSDGEEVDRTVYVEEGPDGEAVYGELPDVDFGPVVPMMWIGLLGGLICAFVCIFKPRLTPIFGTAYALLEGMALGGVSAMFELQFGGIVMQALVATVGVMIAMLALYSTRLIKVNGKFLTFMLAAMGGILILYLVDIMLGAFAGSQIGIIHSTGPWGIGFSIFVCLIAAFNFLIDFDTIEKGVQGGAPKHMEWYSAFGLVLTLVWLYLEILRLIAKARSNNN